MKNSAIEWTDHTFNPWIGCTKVSPACDHCYAEKSMPAKFQGVTWGAGQPRQRTSAANWKQPLRWNKEAQASGTRPRVFCASLADVFDNEVPDDWRVDLFDLISKTPHLDWLLLTKRIGNAERMLNHAVSRITREFCSWTQGGGHSRFKNVWLGATICNQAEADRDIPKLLAVPAAKRFLSIEPMLSSVDLKMLQLKHGDWPGIDWIIAGGESGKDARPMHPRWPRSLRDQCQAAGVPFFFKQWGEWASHPATAGFDEGAAVRSGHVRYLQGDGREPDGHFRRGDAAVRRVGKKAAGRMLDGREWNEVPA